ncbi:MAG: AEC family transporter [Bacteroidales bacterium]|nr:AEC family transporter [Bacteroidales bacterium]
MENLAYNLIPVILIFVLGFLLKVLGVLKQDHGDVFMRVVFYLSLPALVILSLTRIELTKELAWLPLISFSIIMIQFGVAYIIGKMMKLDRRTHGVLMVGTMIMNIGFALPFVIAAYGDEGLAVLSIFDFSNAALAFTLVYYIACRYGEHGNSNKILIKKFAASPPLWALIAGVLLNLSNTAIPPVPARLLQILGDLTIPLIMITLGVFFNIRLIKPVSVFAGIAIRMLLGFFLGLGFCYLLDLDGLIMAVVLIGASAPIGFNSIIYASMEKLDKEYAASMVSFGILAGLIAIPLIIYYLQ